MTFEQEKWLLEHEFPNVKQQKSFLMLAGRKFLHETSFVKQGETKLLLAESQVKQEK
jgi:hypothetical protein